MSLVLSVWLPLSCCCRLQAMAESISRAIEHGPRGQAIACCDHGDHQAAANHAPGKPTPAEKCACGSRERVYLNGVRAALPHCGHDGAVEPFPAATPTALFDFRPDCVWVDRLALAELRERPRLTLLRLHCALTI